ncbi:MAG TPA: DUF3307 domain-containing protein [Ruminiclostridium sp.]
MELTLVTILITLHVLADFYFQTDEIAKNRLINYKAICMHAVRYAIPFACSLAFIRINIKLLLCILLAVLAHSLIDSLKFAINKFRFFDRVTSKPGTIFLVDQLLHMLSIFLIVLLFNSISIDVTLFPVWTNILGIISLDPISTTRWILLILLIMKPANIIFRLLFLSFKPDDVDNDGIEEKNKRAGAIIGCLERILIVIFISVNQYSALGFILAAKSIARYDAISKDKKFAEYYLIGTLVSVVYSIAAFVLVF